MQRKTPIICYGRNSVREAIRADQVLRLKVESRFKEDEVVKEARERGLPIDYVSQDELTRLTNSPSHQGLVALTKEIPTYSLDEIIASVKGKENPLILMLDGIEDPHNLGAILRSADAFGVDAIIMKKRNEVPLNSTVIKVSTGAIYHLKVCVVANLSNAISSLKKNGFWVVSSDGSGTTNYDEVDYSGPIVMIVGSEGFGISRLVLRESDFVVKIPMLGHVNSLNASVSAGILLAEVQEKRKLQ